MANVGSGSSGNNNLRGAISSNSSRGSSRNTRMRDGANYNNRSMGRGASGSVPYRNSNTNSNVMSFQGQNHQQPANIPQQLPEDGGHFWINNSTATTAMTQYFLNNTVTVKTADARCYEGILQGYISHNELCLSHALELGATGGLARPVNFTPNKAICIPMKDIVCMSALNVPEDEVLETITALHPNVPAGGDGFTDEAVRNKSLLNSRSQLSTACDLQEFDLEIDESTEMLDDLNLDASGVEGTWSAEAMFSALPNRRSVATDGSVAPDFDSTFETQYSSVPINITENYQERLRRAEQLSREIIATNHSAGNLELENQESEEARFSAVVHVNDRIDERPAGSTANPRAGTVPAIRGPTLLPQATVEVNGAPLSVPSTSNLSELTPPLVKDRSAKVDTLKKFSENFKLKSKDTPLPPPIPKEQRSNRSNSRPVVTQQIVTKTSPNNTSQSISDQLPNSSDGSNYDAADSPHCSTPPGSPISTEDDTPRSNLNPDAFEFKPRWQQQLSQVDVDLNQLALSAVSHCPPEIYPAAQTPHFIQTTQPSIMMIPQQYYPGGGGGMSAGPMQSHNSVTAQSPSSMAVYPQIRIDNSSGAVTHVLPITHPFDMGIQVMLPYTAQHAVQHQGATFSNQAVSHHPGMYLIPMPHAQQQQMVSAAVAGGQLGPQQQTVSGTSATLKALNQPQSASNSAHKTGAPPLRQQQAAGVVNLGLNGHATGSHQAHQANPHQSAATAQQMLVTGPPIMMSTPQQYYQQQQHQQLLRQHSQHNQQQSQIGSQEYASSGQAPPVHMFYQNSYQLEALRQHQQLHGHRQTPPGVSTNPAATVGTAVNTNNPSAAPSSVVVQQQHIVQPPPVSTPQGMSFPVASMMSQQQMQWNAVAAQQHMQWAAQQHSAASQYQPVSHQQHHHVAYMNSLPPHAQQQQQHFFHATASPYYHPQANYNAAMSQQMMSQQQQQLSSQGPSG